jgi:hypothetical protein
MEATFAIIDLSDELAKEIEFFEDTYPPSNKGTEKTPSTRKKIAGQQPMNIIQETFKTDIEPIAVINDKIYTHSSDYWYNESSKRKKLSTKYCYHVKRKPLKTPTIYEKIVDSLEEDIRNVDYTLGKLDRADYLHHKYNYNAPNYDPFVNPSMNSKERKIATMQLHILEHAKRFVETNAKYEKKHNQKQDYEQGKDIDSRETNKKTCRKKSFNETNDRT